MISAAFYTLGCKVNQYETEAIEELFRAEGFEIKDFDDIADVYVINTCTVTAISDRKSRQIIRRARKQNPCSVIIVTGCYAQTAPEDVLEIEGVNLVIGTNQKLRIVREALRLTNDQKKSLVQDISHTHDFEEMKVTGYRSMTRAYIKIQEGCNQFCSYCIIPYARGPIRSREPQEVIDEARRIVADGFTEIILVGIHIASYGLDIKTTCLADILNEINKIDGIRRIRLSSIEPMTLNREFTHRISAADKLCPHFHLSLQSGCDDTLKRMNRRYTTAEYAEIVAGLRQNFPQVAITTDVMTGFPGETDEEFKQTAEFVRSMEFADIHIFKYSQRKGTPAAKMKEQVSPELKDKRAKILESIREEASYKFHQQMVGKTEPVLFEQPSAKYKGYFEGKTANYVTVLVRTDEDLAFRYRDVQITEAMCDAVKGEML